MNKDVKAVAIAEEAELIEKLKNNKVRMVIDIVLMTIQVVLLLFVFNLGYSTKSCYLWNKDVTEQLAEVNKNSDLLILHRGSEVSKVILLDDLKRGYLKNEYLERVVQKVVEQEKE